MVRWKKYGKKREKNSYFSLKLQHLIFHSFKGTHSTERTKNIYVKRIWCFEMPKFTTSEDGAINDLTKKAGLNEDTLKRRNCVKREFESFISAKGLVSLNAISGQCKNFTRHLHRCIRSIWCDSKRSYALHSRIITFVLQLVTFMYSFNVLP